jgi:hypothetical protein
MSQDKLLKTSAAEFKELCHLAHHIQQLKPWEFMEETDLFGVQDPGSSEIGFVSVMGALGEYEAVAVYRGPEALYAWQDFHDELEINPKSEQASDMLMEIPQLQLWFADANELERRDREIIKNSGLKFTDRKPTFRSHRPGYLPWFLTEPEARYLVQVLTQLIDVAMRFKYDADVIRFDEDPDDNEYLIRVPDMRDSEVVWQDEIRAIDPPANQQMPLSVDESVLSTLRALPKSGILEVDLSTIPARIGEPKGRPRSLYVLMAADSETCFVHGFELLEAKNGIDMLYASVPEKIADMLLKTNVAVPVEFRALKVKVCEMLEPMVSELGSRLSLAEHLRAIDEAKDFLFQRMGMVR